MRGGRITASSKENQGMAPPAAAGRGRGAWPRASGLAGYSLHRLADAGGGRGQDPVAAFRSVVAWELGWGGQRWPGCGPDCVIGCEGTGQAAMFRAVPGQVRAVREFVRSALAGHLAAEDAVAVASELAANTVAHSGSGQAGGMFTVHVNALGPEAAGLAVTELRGAGFPEIQNAGPGTASGRGLVIVQALTSLFWVSDGTEIRILFATIPSPPGEKAP